MPDFIDRMLLIGLFCCAVGTFFEVFDRDGGKQAVATLAGMIAIAIGVTACMAS